MRQIELIAYLKQYPLFSAITLQNKLGKSKAYCNLVLYRWQQQKLIFRIERNKYTVHQDPFLIASRLVWPSYISGRSALQYYHLSDQVPHEITVVVTKPKKNLLFCNTLIRFTVTKPAHFFGYRKIKYPEQEIFIASPEKALIDSELLGKVSVAEIKEILTSHLSELHLAALIIYLIRINSSSVLKRFGYLLELMGKDYHQRFQKYCDATLIFLDPTRSHQGLKNQKWRLIINA